MHTLKNPVTNHHVLFYLLVHGCQSLLSAPGGPVGAVVTLRPRLPLILGQVPVGQRQGPQTVSCILLITNLTHTDTYRCRCSNMYYLGFFLKKSRCKLLLRLVTLDGSTALSIPEGIVSVYLHWGGLRWCSPVPGYWGGASPTELCQLLYSTDESFPLGYALKISYGVLRKEMSAIIWPLFLNFNKC